MIVRTGIAIFISRRFLFLGCGYCDWDPNGSVPSGLVLVFLCRVWRPVLLPLAGYTDVTLRELGQGLTCQVGLLYCQLKRTFLGLLVGGLQSGCGIATLTWN